MDPVPERPARPLNATPASPVRLAYERAAEGGEGALWRQLASATSPEAFAGHWLALQARALGEARAGVLILGEPERGPFTPVGTFPSRGAIGPDLSVAAETAIAERKGVVRDRPAGERGEPSQCVAVPIVVDDELHGVAAFEVEPRSAEALNEAGRRLRWGTAWIEALVRRRSLLPNRQLVEVLDILAMAMEAPRLSVAVQSLVGETARLIGAEWVACGLLRDGTNVQVEAVSQALTPARKQQVMNGIGAAMQEAGDQSEVIRLPEEPNALPVVVRAHRVLAEASGADAVLSVPITHEGRIIGVLTAVGRARAEDRRAEGFTPGECDFCRLLATVIGPALELKRRDDRPIGIKLLHSVRDLLGRLVGPRHLVLKLAAACLVAAAAYLSVGAATYRIGAQAAVEGAVQRAVTAPIAGYIAVQGPRAGDRVGQGDVLARLDDRDFQVERTRWTAEREQRLREYQRALAEGDRTRIQILRADIEQSQARIDLLNEQIARVELRAPIAGLIVRGDLSQSIGAPVGRGDVLFEIAPLDDYRLILKLDERDAAEVALEQEGEVILSSLSSFPLRFRVTKLTPVSVSEEGHNFFRIEAALLDPGPAVRPGMQGYGKVEVGRRSVLFIATARTLQWLRMTVWRFWF